MKRKRFILAAGACLAAMSLITPSAIAEPTGPPTFRALAGTGSDTTQDVLNGLSEVVLGDDPNIPGTDNSKLIASYDAGPIPLTDITTKGTGFPSPTPPPPDDGDCTFIRPSGSTNGVRALVRERARVAVEGGQPCLDFARSSADTSQSPEFTGRGLTYIPFATDALVYATRSDSTISRNLTRDQLRQIYDCALPPAAQANFRPLLPQFGSGTRTFFLQSLGFAESATFTTDNPCVSDRDPTNPSVGLLENTGTLLTDPRHLAPYSIAQYQSQISGAIPDVTGATVLRNVNSIAPTVKNPPAPNVTYATRTDSTISRNLTTANLRAVFTDSAPCLATFRPLLPPSGSATRAAFLAQLGISEAEVGNCVGVQSSENNGTLLTSPLNIAPYSITAYLSQLAGTGDVRGRAILRNFNGIVPTVLNTGASFNRLVFNVVPTSKLTVHPTSTVFVGGSSLVCTNAATITRFGFGTTNQCGDTTRQTPGGTSLP
ncbi:MAG: substrate-binding domain-containing protein [Pseudonocardiaceae bacterium]